MEQKRIEEFERDGKAFMYIDFSNIKTHKEFKEMTDLVKSVVSKYPQQSLYTITNIENVRIDTELKKFVKEYLENNKFSVKYGVVIGIDGIKKVLISTMLKLCGRNNLIFAFSREQAFELLLKQK